MNHDDARDRVSPNRRNETRSPIYLTATLLVAAAFAVSAQQAPLEPTHRDVAYAVVGDKTLSLDLYMPPGVTNPTLLVWVHGGAWRNGTKANPPTRFVVDNG